MEHIVNYIKKNPSLLLLIIPAFLIYLLIIFPSGSEYCFKEKCGIYFWGVHGHDAIWHLAIAGSAFNKIPFETPTFAAAPLSGYNYLLDLIIYSLSKLGIPAIISYFKILPTVWFTVYTGLLIILSRKIKDSPVFVGLFLFFAYFAESFSYLLKLYHEKTIWGSAALLATLKVHMMSNLPFAFSILILLLILIILQNKKINGKTVIFLGTLNLLNLGLKFYGGVITSFLIFLFLFCHFLRRGGAEYLLYLLINVLFIGAAIFIFYDPFSSLKSGSIFTISPFALIHTITEEPNLFYMRNLTNARYFLAAHGIGPRLILIELFNLAAFLFFYLGVKFFGLLYAAYKLLKGKFTSFDWYVFTTIILATFLTATFVQKAEWWNVIQFFYYAIFLSSIFIAKLVDELFRKKTVFSRLIVGVLIILAVPVTLDVIKNYMIFPGVSYVPKEELTALAFLQKQPQGVVFTPLYNRALKDDIAPNEMYRYEDTVYVAAFSGKPVYLADIAQLRLTGIGYEERLKRIKNNDCRIIDEINYVYYLKGVSETRKLIDCSPSRFRQLFSNEAAIIYAVKK